VVDRQDPFGCEKPERVIFLPHSTNMTYKRRFLATCDACLHGRYRGETFGLAVAECVAAGLPVITFADSDSFTPLLLGPWGKYYDGSSETALQQLRNLDPAVEAGRASEYRALVKGFHPLPVMREFVDRFTTILPDNSTISLLDRVLAIENPRGYRRSVDTCTAVHGLETAGWVLASASHSPSASRAPQPSS
jgi:hypothetical protein